MSRNRQDLAKAVSGLGITEERASSAVDAFFERIREALAAGERVALTGFGVWEWKHRPAREARNPRTGEKVLLPARKALVFRPSQQLKRRVNLKGNPRKA
jgi:nucleoid DNA-binding protein